ncbi:DUF2628 domain-containing protein [Hymenobacter sp. CRA2]|uniref:DUF2628 domain-containing protein n=1 Tax=Hymenobacter sp. CRA2 TaxID=1955620 RepID=UPI00098F19AD|nr:DUF2628 domain-containing protein [Hymenobacter sp. CRA2]OON66943.1 hypothetical protein B0919_20380 [Hymenobacter sp. CRA2]
MDINEEYLAAFFGRNADYYLGKWRAWQGGQRISFNGGAFFAGIFWVLYRRMYWVAGLIMLCLVAEAEAEEWLLHRFSFPLAPESQSRTIVVNVLSATILSACANWMYLAYARRKITKVLRTETSEEAILRKLRRQGGTSWTFFIVAAVLVVGIMGLICRYPQYFQ